MGRTLIGTMMETMQHLSVQPEVADAVAAGRPVVALESTIISHGMPFPQNVEKLRRNGRIA